MKNLIKYIFNTITRNLLRFFSTFNAGRYLIEFIQNNIMNLRKKLVHNNIELISLRLIGFVITEQKHLHLNNQRQLIG